MTRTVLDDRRPSVTVKLTHAMADGKELHVIATFGLDRGRVREVFCSSFKDGADVRTLVIDACVCVSLLLQHGYSVQDLKGKLTPPPQSILATLVDAAIEIENGQ